MATETFYEAGAILKVSEQEDPDAGTAYTVSQVSEAPNLPKPVPGREQSRHDISWSFGPVKVTGYVDTTTLEIGVEISVLGIKLGNFYGNLKQGLVIKINLIAASGFIRFFLRGREVWVEVDVSVIFDGTFKKEVKLFTI